MTHQTAILAGVPAHAGFLFLDRRHGTTARQVVAQLAARRHDPTELVGLGGPLLASLGVEVPGFRPMPSPPDAPIAIPRTPADVVVRISGDDPGEVLHRERALLAALPGLAVSDRVQVFLHGESRDLSGYEDGTENPTGDDALAAALQTGQGPGLDGSSVLALQRWIHDLSVLDGMTGEERDAMVGRSRETNEELEDAPETAHVKRTAQESFEPEAFVVRRSMPWRDARGAGLVFVAFGATLDPFEAQLRRMLGLDDGLVDAIFRFTRPVSGLTAWCPPVRDGRLDLRLLG